MDCDAKFTTQNDKLSNICCETTCRIIIEIRPLAMPVFINPPLAEGGGGGEGGAFIASPSELSQELKNE